MKRSLRVLLVEDSPDDAALVVREVGRGGFELSFERVDTRDAMIEALGRAPWDVILSDYSLPKFNAPGALSVLQESGLDIPLILVSGTVGEETAVAALHAGAKDFIIKGKLSRLVPAIERELAEHASRVARRLAEASLRTSELGFKRLWDSGIVGITIANPSGAVIEANDTFLRMVGHRRTELIAGTVNWASMTPEDGNPQIAFAHESIAAVGFARPWEKEYIHADGSRVPVLVAVAKLDEMRNIAISLDLSEQKKLEAQFRQAQRMEAIGSLAGGGRARLQQPPLRDPQLRGHGPRRPE